MALSRLIDELLAANGHDISFLAELDLGVVAHRLPRAELRIRALQAATVLTEHGAGPGERVVIALGNTPASVAWLLGAFACGATAVPGPALDRWRRGPALIGRLRSIIDDSSPAAVVAPATVLTRLRRTGVAVGAALVPELLESAPPAAGPLARDEGEVAFLQYTAGSTGDPKGVVVTLRNLEANLTGIARAVDVRPDDRVLSWLPLHHDMGLVGALMFSLRWRLPLFLGEPASFVYRPDDWLRAISQHRATLSPAPHFAYSLCAHRVPDQAIAGIDLSSWRLALDGSEPIRPETMRLFMKRFAPLGLAPTAYFPVYGLAEATLAVSCPVLGESPRIDYVERRALARGFAEPAPPSSDAAAFVSVGRSLPQHRVEIRDTSSGAVLPERRVGEICVVGPSVTERYFHEPAGVRRGRLATGDLGYIAEGRVYVVDRLKDVIIRAGETYYPADLERVAEAVGGVRRGRVVAFSAAAEDFGVERVVLAAETRRGFRTSTIATEVRRAVRNACGIEIDDLLLLSPRTLPVNAAGKLMRHRVREAHRAHTLQRTPDRLAQIVRWLSGVSRQVARPGAGQ